MGGEDGGGCHGKNVRFLKNFSKIKGLRDGV